MPRTEEENQKIRQQTKDKIIDAAIEVFARNGFNATNTSDIASCANISVGLMYRYFKSKQELFESIVDIAIEGLVSLTNYLNSDEDPKEIVQNVVNSIIYEMDNKHFINLNMTLIHAIIAKENILIDTILEKDQEMFTALERLIERGQKERIFTKGNARGKSILLFSTIQGMVIMKFLLKDNYISPTTTDLLAMLYN